MIVIHFCIKLKDKPGQNFVRNKTYRTRALPVALLDLLKKPVQNLGQISIPPSIKPVQIQTQLIIFFNMANKICLDRVEIFI